MIKSYSVTLVTYMAAFLVAIVTCYFFPYSNQWLMLLAGHLSATLIVSIPSCVFSDSSKRSRVSRIGYAFHVKTLASGRALGVLFVCCLLDVVLWE